MTHLRAITENTVPVSRDYKSGDRYSRFKLGVNSSIHLSKDMCHDYFTSKSFNNFNNFNKKTSNDISFGGLPLNQTSAWKLFNKNWFKKFISMADSSQTIFDAIFALGITCFLRPAAIMAQSTPKTREKNKKASSHSISSGIIGYGFAVIVFSPIKKALDKLKANPEKFAKKAEAFLKSSQNAQTFTMVINKGSEALVASGRSAITIAMIPIIDKYILNPLLNTKTSDDSKKELQNPSYRYSYINFKNKQESNVFNNFTGVMK